MIPRKTAEEDVVETFDTRCCNALVFHTRAPDSLPLRYAGRMPAIARWNAIGISVAHQ